MQKSFIRRIFAAAVLVLLCGLSVRLDVYASSQVTVKINSIRSILTSSADINIGVVNSSSSTVRIDDMGVVYSKNNMRPDINNADSVITFASTVSNYIDVTIRGLEANNTYYIRAFARDSRGTVYYSAMQEFKTTRGFTIETRETADIGGAAATLRGSIERNDETGFKSKGFVYSQYTYDLTIAYGSPVYVSGGELGDFSAEISGLKPNTRYYVRAFVDTDNGISYGNTVDFITRGMVTININFISQLNENVGKQTFELLAGVTIEASELRLPYDYQLADEKWSFSSMRNEDINVPVVTIEKHYMRQTSADMFEPDKAITREDVARIIYLLYGKDAKYTTAVFSDVSSNYPYMNEIAFVSMLGVMTGNPDGTFKPYLPIKRAELCVVLSKLYELPEYTGADRFNDIEGHWGKGFINAVSEAGMMSGGTDGRFRPDDNTTRAEAASIFARSEHRSLIALSDKKFKDVPETHWAYKYIMNAAIPGR